MNFSYFSLNSTTFLLKGQLFPKEIEIAVLPARGSVLCAQKSIFQTFYSSHRRTGDAAAGGQFPHRLCTACYILRQQKASAQAGAFLYPTGFLHPSKNMYQ